MDLIFDSQFFENKRNWWSHLVVVHQHHDSNVFPSALRDLVPFVQFKKREKHPWRNTNFKKVAG